MSLSGAPAGTIGYTFSWRFTRMSTMHGPPLCASAWSITGSSSSIVRARTLEELDAVVDQALAHRDGPCIVDIRVKRQEKVYPMVPAGAPLNDMIGGE